MSNYIIKYFKIVIMEFFNRAGYKVQKIENIPLIVEADEFDLETIRLARKISMQSHERLWALINATKYIALNNIPGAFVECGVYKGGSAVVIARTLNRYNVLDRKIYLYDTYEGMTEPKKIDKKIGTNTPAIHILNSSAEQDGVWAYASFDSVTKVIESLDYPKSNFIQIKGDVSETLRKVLPTSIALLRLDTDWHESTLVELEILYPLVVKKGSIIIDDYGHWSGAKSAVDDYLELNQIKPLMNYIDYAGRLWIKT